MALVQAFRRIKTYTYQFKDVKLVFEPNEKGDVVCDVADPGTVDRLLQTPTGFRLYGEQADEPMSPVLSLPVSQVTSEPEKSPYLLADDESGAVLDLRPMSDAELHAFADANGIKVHPNAKGDTIRNKIVEFLNSEG